MKHLLMGLEPLTIDNTNADSGKLPLMIHSTNEGNTDDDDTLTRH